MLYCEVLHTYLKDMYGLLLHREHRQYISVQVQPLIVWQNDFVTLKGACITQPACVQVYDVQWVVLKRRAWVRCHRFIVSVHLKKVWMRFFRQVSSWADDHITAVVSEKTALSIQVLAIGGHVGDVEKGKEAFKEFASDFEGALVVPIGQRFSLLTLKKIFSSLASLVLVYFQRSLIRRKRYKASPVRGELTQEAGWLLYIHHCEVGEQVLVEAAHTVPMCPDWTGADPASF